MTQFPDLFAALAAPFHPEEVRVRPQAGRQLHYVTARTVMNRLDSVLGPENWFDSYDPGEHSVLCKLTIRLPDGALLTKQDAGGYAGMADSGDDDKSGYSDSFKRAAVKFGVGRYLYRDGVPGFAQERVAVAVAAEPAAEAPGKPAERPAAPAPGNGPARPRGPWSGGYKPEPGQPSVPAERANRGDRTPATGKQLFGWLKDQEQRYQVGLIKYINGWSKLQDFPGRMVDFDAGQVGLAHAEALRKLAAIQAAGGEPVYQGNGNGSH